MDLNQAEDISPLSSSPFPDPQSYKQRSGENEKEGRTMNPSIQFKTTTMPFLIAFALACFGPLPSTQALAPPPDGGYPGANTAEGTGALSSLSPQGRGSGANNTALGYHTLFSDTTGSFNTATGSVALAN